MAESTPPEADPSSGKEPGAPNPLPAAREALPPASEEPPESWETRFKYLLADFENFRRRIGREQERHRDRARAELLQAVLPLFEATERARATVRRMPESDPIRKGVELLAKEWDAFFEVQNIVPMAKPGMTFKADIHEAVAETAPGPGHPDGTVAEVVQQGYRVGDGLLRPAKVVVARKKATVHAPAAEPAAPVAEPGEDPPR